MENKNKRFTNISIFWDHGACDYDLRKETKFFYMQAYYKTWSF